MFKCLMGPGLGPQGKCEGLCVGSFNNCFGKFVPFFNGPISFFSLSDHQNKPQKHKGKCSKRKKLRLLSHLQSMAELDKILFMQGCSKAVIAYIFKKKTCACTYHTLQVGLLLFHRIK